MGAVYNIGISGRAKRILDDSRGPYHRNRLQQYFHANYEDTRSQLLKNENLWCINNRPFRTTVILTIAQVQEILALADDMEIIAKYSHKYPNPTYLLGTFLDAVLTGNLTSKAEEAPAQ